MKKKLRTKTCYYHLMSHCDSKKVKKKKKKRNKKTGNKLRIDVNYHLVNKHLKYQNQQIINTAIINYFKSILPIEKRSELF